MSIPYYILRNATVFSETLMRLKTLDWSIQLETVPYSV